MLSCDIGHLYVFLGEMSVQVFGPLLNGVLGILYILLILNPWQACSLQTLSAILQVVFSLFRECPVTHGSFSFLCGPVYLVFIFFYDFDVIFKES